CLTQDTAIGPQHGLLIPDALVDELLQRLLRVAAPARHTDAVAQGLDTFTLTVQKQALQVDARPTRPRDIAEATGELSDVLVQPLEYIRFKFHDRRPRHAPTLRLDRNTPVARLTLRTHHKHITTTE